MRSTGHLVWRQSGERVLLVLNSSSALNLDKEIIGRVYRLFFHRDAS